MDDDDSFEDEWWDSLAIDRITDSQLQALEQSATSAHHVAGPTSAADDLQPQLEEVRACETAGTDASCAHNKLNSNI